MPHFLYAVTEVFDIGGRYLVATPGIPLGTPGIRDGATLQLHRPDGSVFVSHVHSVAFVDPFDPKRPIQFSFPPGLTKADIPVGTEVWLAEDTPAV